MDDLPELGFAKPAELEQWLAAHVHAPGMWLRCGKKGCPEPAVTYAEALDVALCWGWIDGQKAPLSEHYFLQRFTPRRRASRWSAANVDRVAALTVAGRMRPPGTAQVAAARADGRWAQAYAGAATVVVPPELSAALIAVPGARRAFEGLNAANRYAVLYRLASLKRPASRERVAAEVARRLADGWVPHPAV